MWDWTQYLYIMLAIGVVLVVLGSYLLIRHYDFGGR